MKMIPRYMVRPAVHDPFPDGHYIHPFHQGRYHSTEESKEHPRTIVEMKMCALSNAIREEPNWWEKIKDPALVKKWSQGILDQQKNEFRIRQLTEKMVSYVFQELHGYASVRDPDTGTEVGPYERIWRSDSLIPSDLRDQLVAAVSPLENAPAEEKDWQPRSNNQVLSLVHPYLYPIVYNRTLAKSPRASKYGALRPPGGSEYYVSQNFQWLPSDFAVAEDGSVTLASSYINNIHPQKHAALESIVPKLLQCAVPLWGRVLSDLRRPLLPFRTKSAVGNPLPDCIFEVGQLTMKDEVVHGDLNAWLSGIKMNLPDARERYTGDLDVMKTPTVSLKGSTIQCIIKLVNIVLTPEKPEYPGGNWHVEGMENEHIVSSFIYYYGCENITSSRLAFRRATCEPKHHARRGEGHCKHVLYEIKDNDRDLQELGSVETLQGRCVAFPNIYQHQVQPFRLEDPTKPGFRKIFVAFLVDPTYTIPSATIIASQQREIIREVMLTADNSWLGRLPAEIINVISGGNDGTMSRAEAEAEAYRLQNMDERTTFARKSDSDYFGTNMPVLAGD